MKNKLDNSRLLDVWIWSNKPEVKSSTDFIVSKLKKEFPSGYTEKNIKKHLRVILTDLFVAHKNNPKLYISFSRDIKAYRGPLRFAKVFLNYRYVIWVTDYLNENGYIELHKGVNFNRFRRMSRMKATEKLVRLFRKYQSPEGVIINRKPSVIVRDSEKRDMDFDFDTIEAKALIRNTNRINKYLSEHYVSFWPPFDMNEDYSSVYKLMENHVKYTRIFNNASLQQGGRFYGHWSQMITSDWRKYIRIDRQPSVELDYSCLHLSMLYGLEEMFPPDKDLYSLAGISSLFRPLIKKAVNIAINASSESEAAKALRQEYQPFMDTVGYIPDKPESLLHAIKWNHNPIEKYFCSGYGVHLQFIDSSLAEKIMLSLYEKDICCLCIHDSFIVAEKYQILLNNAMRDCFYERFGFYPKINMK